MMQYKECARDSVIAGQLRSRQKFELITNTYWAVTNDTLRVDEMTLLDQARSRIKVQ